MWNVLEYGFRVAFEEAWAAYSHRTFPIGACILDTEGKVVARGRNQVYSAGEGPLAGHGMGHAEMNALLEIGSPENQALHPRMREYTLYTTMEPCPMCFGAVVMSRIRQVRYAARDSWAGAAALNEASEYIRMKNIRVEGPFDGPDAVSVALHICWFMERMRGDAAANRYLPIWEPDSPPGHRVGIELAASGALGAMARAGMPARAVYNHLLGLCGKK